MMRAAIAALRLRPFDDDDRGYGFIGGEIPGLRTAVKEARRNQGPGTRLPEMIPSRSTIRGFRALSPCVAGTSRAVTLYRRSGFEIFHEANDSYTMITRP